MLYDLNILKRWLCIMVVLGHLLIFMWIKEVHDNQNIFTVYDFFVILHYRDLSNKIGWITGTLIKSGIYKLSKSSTFWTFSTYFYTLSLSFLHHFLHYFSNLLHCYLQSCAPPLVHWPQGPERTVSSGKEFSHWSPAGIVCSVKCPEFLF